MKLEGKEAESCKFLYDTRIKLIENRELFHKTLYGSYQFLSAVRYCVCLSPKVTFVIAL